MTVYVDDVYIRAKVGQIDARWCHLMADSHTELMAFAHKVGLHAAWLQHPGPREREHFDVTISVRVRCVAAGAVEINWRDLGEVLAQLRRCNNPDLVSRLAQCSDCSDVRVLSGPWCDAANEELWLCNDCILQSKIT